ncbi:hypothetical protein GGI35DRAFT_193752 [Trichoderma velutinum]
MELARQIKFANFVPNASPCWLTACRIALKGATGGRRRFQVFFLLAALHCRLRACAVQTTKYRYSRTPSWALFSIPPASRWGRGEREDGRGLRLSSSTTACNASLRVCPSSSQTPISRDTCTCFVARR